MQKKQKKAFTEGITAGILDNTTRELELIEIQDDSRALVAETKARLANAIKVWATQKRKFKSLQAAADAIGEHRTVMSRVVAGKLLHISTDKLVAIAGAAGLSVRVETGPVASSADKIRAWLTRIWSDSMAKVFASELTIEYQSEEMLTEHLVSRLRAFDTSDRSECTLKMICTGKKWDIDLCSSFYRDVASIANSKRISAVRVFAGGDRTFEYNRALARLSTETGIDTHLLDVRTCPNADFVPPRGMGFWILGKNTVVIHISTEADKSYLVGEVNSPFVAACLEQGVFAPTKRLATKQKHDKGAITNTVSNISS